MAARVALQQHNRDEATRELAPRLLLAQLLLSARLFLALLEECDPDVSNDRAAYGL